MLESTHTEAVVVLDWGLPLGLDLHEGVKATEPTHIRASKFTALWGDGGYGHAASTGSVVVRLGLLCSFSPRF